MLILAKFPSVCSGGAARAPNTIFSSRVALHHAQYLSLGNFRQIPADCRLGMMGETTMSALEAAILSLVIVWMPGMAFAAYLLMPRRPEARLDQVVGRDPYTRNVSHPTVNDNDGKYVEGAPLATFLRSESL